MNGQMRAGENNPSMQTVLNDGLILVIKYQDGPQHYGLKTGPGAMNREPLPGNAHGVVPTSKSMEKGNRIRAAHQQAALF